MVLEDTLTVAEEVRKVFSHVRQMHRDLDALSEVYIIEKQLRAEFY